MTYLEATDFLNSLSNEFSLAENKQEELEHLIELGQELKQDFDLKENSKARVSGCASNTFVQIEKSQDEIVFKAFSDSYVVSGYLAIFQHTLGGLQFQQFDETIQEIKSFAQKHKFNVSHIPSRADAFNRILIQIEEQYKNL